MRFQLYFVMAGLNIPLLTVGPIKVSKRYGLPLLHPKVSVKYRVRIVCLSEAQFQTRTKLVTYPAQRPQEKEF